MYNGLVLESTGLLRNDAREVGAGKEEGWREAVHWDGHHTGKAHMIWVSWINLLNFT